MNKFRQIFLGLFLIAVWVRGSGQQVGTCGVKTRISVTSTADTRVQLCASDNSPSVLQFRASSPALPYVILVTDDSGIIQAVSYQLSIDFDQFAPGRYRVYVLSFLGSLRAKPGMRAFEDSLAKLCYGLSANYIIVSTLPPSGGSLTFADGSGAGVFCPGNGVPDILSFATNSPDAGFHYIIADTSDVILDVVDQPFYDFDQADGPRHIWGLSLTGAVPDVIGQKVQDANLNGACSSVSTGFITASPVFPEGGLISFGSGVPTIRQCAGDPRNAALSLQHTSTSAAAYAYLLTDSSNRFVKWLSAPELNVPGLPVGVYRVWGLSYTGNLNSNLSGDIRQLALSDNCMELSSNYLEVEVYAVDSGEITTSQGLRLARICLNDNQAGTFSFKTRIFPGYAGALVAVDGKGVVQGVFDVNAAIDFLPLPGLYSKVYSISYEGTLTLQAGMLLQDASVSGGGCMALSQNYVEVLKENPQGGAVRLVDGATEKSLCFIEGVNPGAVEVATTGTGNYRFLLVDARDVVRAVLTEGKVDLGAFPAGSYRLFGLSYTGAFNIFPQAHIQDYASFADGCSSLSDNFVLIHRYNLDGGTVSLPNTGGATAFCSDGLSEQVLSVATSSNQYPLYGYVLTDSENQIIRSYTTSMVRLDPMDAGVFRIWGLAYSGQLQAEEGDILEEATLSTSCYVLSKNFISISRAVSNGGTIADQNGKTAYTGCVDPGGEKELYVTFSTAYTGENSVFMLTDVSNKVLLTQESSFFSFEGFLPGSFRIWHLAYSGDLLLKKGQKIGEAVAASGCYDFSDNFISVALESPDGGTVRLSTGATELNLCIGGGSGFVSFRNTSTASLSYQYVLTNEQEQVMLVLVGANFDISVAPAGSYRVYGISYTGKLTLKAGMNIRTAAVSDRCYAVSRNYITLRNELVRGGEIAFSDDLVNPIKYICPQEQGDKPLNLLRIGTQGPSYAFLAIDNSGTIVSVGTNESIRLNGLPEGEYQIWGLAYSGALFAAPGINPATSPLAERCASLSSNALRVTWASPLGGTVSLVAGGVFDAVCPDSASSKRVEVVGADQEGGRVTYVLADGSSRIIAVNESGVFQLDSLADGIYKIWSLTFNGTLLARKGMLVGMDNLASTCFALSSNVVLVNKEQPAAGTLALALLGVTDSVVCSGGAGSANKQLELRSAGSSKTPYVFLATDTLNQLRFVIPETPVKDTSSTHSAVLALDDVPGGAYKIWGLAYTGTLQLETGMRVDTSLLADDCYALSASMPFRLQSADGAQVQARGFNGDTIYVCIGDNKQDSVYFTNTSTGSGGGYRYVLTNTSNLVLAELNGDVMNFENAGFKELRVWGISYTGTYVSVRNKNILSAVPSNGCYEVSENYLTIFRDVPNGGTITIDGTTTERQFCPGRDGYTLQVKTSSTSKTGYVYILADTVGAVREVSRSGLIDFRNHPIGSYRVHGLAYTGNLSVKAGDTLRMDIPVAGSCYQWSSNYIRVNRGAEVNGQSVSTLFGETTLGTCPGDGLLDLVILNQPIAGTESVYQLMLTNERNQIIYPDIQGGLLDFEGIAAGVYRIWGVSYGGNFIGQYNTVVGVESLSTGCFDLSDNYITVIAETPKGGTVYAGNNLTSLVVNRADKVRDVYFFGKKDASPRAPYVFLLTNEQDAIISVVTGDSIDLDLLPTGNYRVRGLAYTGSLLAAPGAVIGSNLLSDNCHELSSNWVLIEVRSTSNIPNTGDSDTPRIVVSSFVKPLALQVMPNPVLDEALLVFNSAQEESLVLSMYSLDGVRLLTRKIDAAAGANQVALNLESQLPGVYILRLAGKYGQESVRIVKW